VGQAHRTWSSRTGAAEPVDERFRTVPVLEAFVWETLSTTAGGPRAGSAAYPAVWQTSVVLPFPVAWALLFTVTVMIDSVFGMQEPWVWFAVKSSIATRFSRVKRIFAQKCTPPNEKQ
jgi:hypothetical protein